VIHQDLGALQQAFPVARGGTLRQRSTLCASVPGSTLVESGHVQQRGRLHVDLALRLDVLVMCAAFAFVGAILLGAF
jgi:hypothetical protein